jgi:asparagine synthase (glutamine-hydrolysing)
MCGITGFFHYKKAGPTTFETLKEMTNLLRHRGPDGEGFFYQGMIGLGHRRLAIIDLETGQQPMFSPNKDLVIVFNGEIYNYLELRHALEALGHRFHTNSDTEVILNAYKQWDVDCQSHLNGMWAFALWDTEKRRLFISRDRIGEKPLYYSTSKGCFFFASEIKSLMKAGVPRDINTVILQIYLSHGYIPAPYTFYSCVSKLKAGHYLIVTQGNLTIYKYWDLPEVDESEMLSAKESIHERFAELFSDAVKIRMRSDVPFGAFLSGGLDSSSVVAVMSNMSPYPINTYTVGTHTKRHDESPIAKTTSQTFSTNHHASYFSREQFKERFDETLERMALCFGEPFGDSSAIPTGHIAQLASQDVKMVLTGDGGDEVLSGYPAYRAEKLAAKLKDVPDPCWNVLHLANRLLSYPLTGILRYAVNRFDRYSLSLNASFIDRLISNILPKSELDLIEAMTQNKNDIMPVKEFLTDFFNHCPYKDPFYKLMVYDLKISLPDDMLVKVDRMTMAHSLEARSPFLDFRLIEYLVRVHKDVKMEGLESKSILRRTIGLVLPNSVLRAPKRGFVIPVRDWFRDKTFHRRLDTLAQSEMGLNKEIIRKIVSDHKDGAKDYGYLLWFLFVLRTALSQG